MTYCSSCGRKFGILTKKHQTDDGKMVCYHCIDNYKINIEQEDTANDDNNDIKFKILKSEETETIDDKFEEDIVDDENHPAIIELNKKQRRAVLSKSKRLLILAGAGSGKTKTLIQKILFLISEKNIDPRNILAITFTRNATNEMKDRLILSADKESKYRDILYDKKLSYKDKEKKRREYIKKYPWMSGITVQTFHGLCNQLLRTRGGEVFDNKFKILSDRTYDADLNNRQQANDTPEEIINKLILKLAENPEYLLDLKRYILDHYIDTYRIKKHKKKFVEYERPYTTLNGENVFSKSERDIADWLYRHRIRYKYEPIIQPGSFEMQPDFLIEEANLYLEHISNKSYPMTDKNKVMEEAGENYVKIYEQAMQDTKLFNKTMDDIIFSRIDKHLKNVSPLEFAEEFKGYEKQRRAFVLDILKMIEKIKVRNKNFNKIYEKSQNDLHSRVREFYQLAKPIYEEYHNYNVDHSYLDFNDLIIKTIEFLDIDEKARKAYQKKYKYVLVDEFQDVNNLQVKLLNHFLSDKNQLFCVGDDWQSIYGFRGSNVEYIVNFEKYFPDSKIIKLDINYRSNDTIVNASNQVINNNKFKIEKELNSYKKEGKNIYLYCAEKEDEDGVEEVVKTIKKFIKNGVDKEDILLLSRTRKTESFDKYFFKLRQLGVKATTIHQSKGLEAKIVFIVGLTGGFLGFPYVRDDDRIFQIIHKSDYDLLMEEERRLFYVALTRAMDEVFLISEVANESEFISEIPGEFIDRTNFLKIIFENNLINQCIKCNKILQSDYKYCPFCGNLFFKDKLDDDELKIKDIKEEDSEIIENIIGQNYTISPIKIYDLLKKDYQNHLLFIQNGIFYELYGADAKKCSEIFGWKISYNNFSKGIGLTGTPINQIKFKERLTELKKPFILIKQEGKNEKGKIIRKITDIFSFDNDFNINNGDLEKRERLNQLNVQLLILKCLNKIETNVGRKLLSFVLKGSNSQIVFDTKTNFNQYYGVLKDYSLKDIAIDIDDLISSGYISKYESEKAYSRPLIRLTDKGKESIVEDNFNLNSGKKTKNIIREWIDSEDEQLKIEFNEGMSISDIALKHNRTNLAIRARLNRLGLTGYRNNSSTNKQNNSNNDNKEEEDDEYSAVLKDKDKLKDYRKYIKDKDKKNRKQRRGGADGGVF